MCHDYEAGAPEPGGAAAERMRQAHWSLRPLEAVLHSNRSRRSEPPRRNSRAALLAQKSLSSSEGPAQPNTCI